mmetsp:Transcript_25517/g.37561  ORF Transcript_25517/g.37561 Transcript_25517/m.37561 type:complete len:90 (-) Transcript_25517:208-477(-)
MVEIEGHEVMMLGSVASLIGITQGCLGKGWAKHLIHRYPVVALSLGWAGFGLALPIVIVPIRRRLGMPTNHYDAAHPKAVFPKLGGGYA